MEGNYSPLNILTRQARSKCKYCWLKDTLTSQDVEDRTCKNGLGRQEEWKVSWRSLDRGRLYGRASIFLVQHIPTITAQTLMTTLGTRLNHSTVLTPHFLAMKLKGIVTIKSECTQHQPPSPPLTWKHNGRITYHIQHSSSPCSPVTMQAPVEYPWLYIASPVLSRLAVSPMDHSLHSALDTIVALSLGWEAVYIEPTKAAPRWEEIPRAILGVYWRQTV